MGFARDDSDRMLVFDHGQIVEQGPPDTIFTNPSHRRAQRFLKAVIEHV
jgi:polar amino acid transport system ATP-binding protein